MNEATLLLSRVFDLKLCLLKAKFWFCHPRQLGFVYIDMKAKATSLPGGFIGNPIECSYSAATKIKGNNSLSLNVNEP